ncbi:MAG: ribonuclease [Phycisphaerales bacterium]|nr:ribonuclease [Phycisphaerales bacterium]
MAKVRDLVFVLRHLGPMKFGQRVLGEVSTDNVFTNAAAMAYAWVFAIFPLLIFLMALVPYLPKRFRDATPDYIGDMMYGAGMTYAIVGPVQETAKSLLTNTHSGLLSFGLLLTLYAASGGMNTTMAALDTAMDIDKFRPFWLKRIIAMVLTVFTGLSFFVVILMLPIGSIITKLVSEYTHYLPQVAQGWMTSKMLILTTLIRYAIGLTVMQIMIGVLYQFGPSKRQPMRFFTVGSLFTAVGWIATGFALRYYFSMSKSYDKTYGAVAGMVIMLMVFYLDAAIILIGAELDTETIKARDEIRKSGPPDNAGLTAVPSPSA